MESLISILIVIVLTWWGLDTFYYSPKAQIKKLQKEIIQLIAKKEPLKDTPKWVSEDTYESFYKEAISCRKKLIDALLEYYFDPVADEEYIRENKSL